MDLAVEMGQAFVYLLRPAEAKDSLQAVWSILPDAPTHRTTVEPAGQALGGMPHSNPILGALSLLPREALEVAVNHALVAHCPPGLRDRPLEGAIDLKLIPSYGEPQRGEEDFLLPGQAQAGPLVSSAMPPLM